MWCLEEGGRGMATDKAGAAASAAAEGLTLLLREARHDKPTHSTKAEHQPRKRGHQGILSPHPCSLWVGSG